MRYQADDLAANLRFGYRQQQVGIRHGRTLLLPALIANKSNRCRVPARMLDRATSEAKFLRQFVRFEALDRNSSHHPASKETLALTRLPNSVKYCPDDRSDNLRWQGSVMETTIEIPKAFSVRDDHEFLAFKHLMARLNPHLRVRQVGMGLHVRSGHTVFWGLVSVEGQRVSREEFDQALQDAGFDFEHHAAQVDYETVC